MIAAQRAAIQYEFCLARIGSAVIRRAPTANQVQGGFLGDLPLRGEPGQHRRSEEPGRGPLYSRRLLAPCGTSHRRRRVRCSLRAWALPACDHTGRWRLWRPSRGPEYSPPWPGRDEAGPGRQRQTAATTLPPIARYHPVSTLRPAQMTAIDFPATHSHLGGRRHRRRGPGRHPGP